MKSFPKNKGFTLVETLLYLFFLVLLLVVVIGLLVSLSRSYQTIKAAKNVESSAIFSLERMTRDIRGATSINVAQSTFAATSSVLALNSTDESGNAQTIRFYVSGNALKVDVDGSTVGPLTLPSVTVTNLSFRRSTTTNSEAVKIDLGLRSQSGSAIKTADFNTSVVLRGSY